MSKKPDYYVATSQRGDGLTPWSWEIRRQSAPMGIKWEEVGFPTKIAAEFAGKRALDEFLKLLAQEERRTTK